MKKRSKIPKLLIGSLLLGGLLLALAWPKRPSTVPKFRYLPLSGSYQAQIPGTGLSTTLKATSQGAEIEVSRSNSSLQMTLPLNKANIRKDKEEIVYTIPEKTLETRYKLLPNGLKEEIVLNKKIDSSEFISELSLKNLTVKYTPEGIPLFFDNRGTYQFHFQKPFAQDAKGSITYAVKQKLIPIYKDALSPLPSAPLESGAKGGKRKLLGEAQAAEVQTAGYQLVLTVDEAWLSDPNRAYPVVIDPTVVYDTSSEFADGSLDRITDTGSPNLETYYQGLPADQHTVGLWHMDETTGSSVADSSGNGHNGSAIGTIIETADQKLGTAARSFNGTSDYISLGTELNSITSLPVTIEAWIKVDSQTGTVMIVQQNESATNYYGFRFGVVGTYQLDVSYGSGGAIGAASRRSYTTPVNTLTAGQWYHVAGVIRGATDMSIYVNGVNVGGTYAGSGGAMSVSGNGSIGRGVFASNFYFDGIIDEVRISNIVRTPEEIKADAQRRSSAVYTSDAIDLASPGVTAWNSLSWTKLGVATGGGETLAVGSTGNLVAQWNFNSLSGTTATNDAGSCGSACNGGLFSFLNTTGQDVGSSPPSGWTTDNKRWGAGALMFDGTNDYVSTANNSSLNITDSLTIETWVNDLNVGLTIPQVIINKVEKGNLNYRLGIGHTSPGDIYFNYNAGGGAFSTYRTASSLVETGQWHYIAATYNNAAGAHLYLDGVEAKGTWVTGGVGSLPAGTGPLYLGMGVAVSDGTTKQNYLNGILDSTRIYNRVLSASEILSNYNAANIEFQTRVGNSADPNDGTWEAWMPTTDESQIDSLDTSQASWLWDMTGAGLAGSAADYMPKAKADDPTIKMEGGGSLKLTLGVGQTEANLIGLWHLEETGTGVGTSFYDASGNGNHGVGLTMPAPTDGFAGKARSFDGVDDYIKVNSTLGLSNTSVTMMGWVNLDSASEHGTMIKIGNSASGYGFGVGANHFEDNGNDLIILFEGVRWIDTNTTIGTGWHHLAMVIAGTGVPSGYIDGRLINSYTGANAVVPAGSSGIGGYYPSRYLDAAIDEVAVYNRSLGSEEIAEAYRAGRDHRLSRTINPADLSNETKLPFYVASDRLGTFMEVGIGESAYANYEPDANTIGLWRLDEEAGIGGTGPANANWIKDYSGNAYHGTDYGGSTFTDGKIGKARNFDGSNDYISVADNASLDLTTFTVDLWINPERCNYATYQGIVGKGTGDLANRNYALFITANTCNIHYSFGNGTTWASHTSSVSLALGQWYHLAYTFGGGTSKFYINGVLDSSYSETITPTTNAEALTIGTLTDYSNFDGSIDEVRVSNSVRTADEIREAYEIGKRTHSITIDFKASIGTGTTVASTATSFMINAIPYGIGSSGGNLYEGDKIILKEKVGGTEYLAQGTVNSVNAGSGAVTVTAWDAGSTFPAGGYTVYATVFKWQREYFDLTGSLSTHRDAVNRITLRVTDGSAGANVWLDDFRSVGNYLTDPAGSTITSSLGRYFQYRAIFSSNDPAVSPSLSSVTLDYEDLNAPTGCLLEEHREDSQIIVKWNDTNSAETGYQIQRGTDGAAFADLITKAADSTSHTDSSISGNHTYRYRIRAEKSGVYSDWCNTSELNLGQGSFKFEGVKMEGVKID